MRTLTALYFLIAASMAAAAPVDDGVRAFDRGDHAAAYAIWRPLAEAGNPLAQYNLGLLYANGWGVERDLRTAADWYRKAAARDQADAQYNLGLLYARGQLTILHSYKDAYLWWQRAAALGHAAARFNLGVLYAYGRGVGRDTVLAIDLWRQAAGQGYGPAAAALVRVYERGELGVAADPQQAEVWRRRATSR